MEVGRVKLYGTIFLGVYPMNVVCALEIYTCNKVVQVVFAEFRSEVFGK